MNKNVELLLKRHFQGHSTKEDEKELQLWRDEDDFNDEEYLRLREAWNKDRSISDDLPEDEKWSKFKKKHFKPDTKTKVLRSKSIIKYTLISVIFLGLFTLGIYYSGSTVYRTTKGERQLISLNDGSNIWLREDSRLTVGRIFNGFARKVNLDGSAIFDLEPNTQKQFTALGSQSMARGNGGVWLYTATDTLNKLQVFEGKGKFWHHGKGDTVTVDENNEAKIVGGRLLVDTISNEEPKWYTGYFEFNRTPLKKAFTCIQDHYKVNVKLKKGVALKGCRISGTFDQLPLRVMLDSIQKQVRLNYQVNDQTITVNKVKCPRS